MGTNYYARHPGIAPGEEGLHIGKASGGWEFLWRAHPQYQLTTSAAWRAFLRHPWAQVTIVAEYGTEVSLDEFWEFATDQSGQRRNPHDTSCGHRVIDASFQQRQWRDEAGRPFADYEFC